MYIVSTAFAPHNDQIDSGGQAHWVSLTCVGGMVAAEKDSYKQVYLDDRSEHYKYPQRPGNQQRKKGRCISKAWRSLIVRKAQRKSQVWSALLVLKHWNSGTWRIMPKGWDGNWEGTNYSISDGRCSSTVRFYTAVFSEGQIWQTWLVVVTATEQFSHH